MARRRCTRLFAAWLLATAGATVAAAADPLPVTVRPAGELRVPLERSAPATAVALQRTEVAARIAAPVTGFDAEVGDRVRADAPLARLECVDAEDARDAAVARLAEAEARARLAQLRLERIQRLRAQDAVSADELDQAEAERRASAAAVSALRAERARARRDVERCTVPAPETGTVTARHADVGDFVQPGTALLTVVADDAIEARALVTAGDAGELLAARRASMRAGGRSYDLADPRRTGVVDPATGTEEVRLRFAGERPRPGTAGRVHWLAAPDALPADLLVRRDGRLGVFIARDGRARFHPLDDAVEGRPAPAGLPTDARVIIEGRHAATDGRPLKILE